MSEMAASTRTMLSANGFDAQCQRHKWFCAQAWQHGAAPSVRLPDTVYPPPECPFQNPNQPHGLIRNIAERFRDDSLRLVRDVPFGSAGWKQLYHRARSYRVSSGSHTLWATGWGSPRHTTGV